MKPIDEILALSQMDWTELCSKAKLTIYGCTVSTVWEWGNIIYELIDNLPSANSPTIEAVYLLRMIYTQGQIAEKKVYHSNNPRAEFKHYTRIERKPLGNECYVLGRNFGGWSWVFNDGSFREKILNDFFHPLVQKHQISEAVKWLSLVTSPSMESPASLRRISFAETRCDSLRRSAHWIKPPSSCYSYSEELAFLKSLQAHRLQLLDPTPHILPYLRFTLYIGKMDHAVEWAIAVPQFGLDYLKDKPVLKALFVEALVELAKNKNVTYEISDADLDYYFKHGTAFLRYLIQKKNIEAALDLVISMPGFVYGLYALRNEPALKGCLVFVLSRLAEEDDDEVIEDYLNEKISFLLSLAVSYLIDENHFDRLTRLLNALPEDLARVMKLDEVAINDDSQASKQSKVLYRLVSKLNASADHLKLFCLFLEKSLVPASQIKDLAEIAQENGNAELVDMLSTLKFISAKSEFKSPKGRFSGMLQATQIKEDVTAYRKKEEMPDDTKSYTNFNAFFGYQYRQWLDRNRKLVLTSRDKERRHLLIAPSPAPSRLRQLAE